MQKQNACQRCSSCIRLLPQLPDPVFRLLAHFRGVQLVELSLDEGLQLGPVVALERAQVFKVPLGMPDLGLDSLLGAEQRVEFLPGAGECVGSLDFFVRIVVRGTQVAGQFCKTGFCCMDCNTRLRSCFPAGTGSGSLGQRAGQVCLSRST